MSKQYIRKVPYTFFTILDCQYTPRYCKVLKQTWRIKCCMHELQQRKIKDFTWGKTVAGLKFAKTLRPALSWSNPVSGFKCFSLPSHLYLFFFQKTNISMNKPYHFNTKNTPKRKKKTTLLLLQEELHQIALPLKVFLLVMEHKSNPRQFHPRAFLGNSNQSLITEKKIKII